MKYCLAFIFIGLFATLGFAQHSSNFLEIKQINIFSSEFQVLKSSNAIEKNINRTPPTESQFEDRQSNSVSKLESDNQSISVFFKSLTDRKIKSVSFLFRLTQNDKKIFERNINDKPHYFSDTDFSIRDRFFAVENLSFSNINTVREVIIKQIVFEDGKKIKF